MKKIWVFAFVFAVIIAGIILVSSVNLDLNHDGIINVQDLQLLASHYESKMAYNSSFDLNNDSRVDLFDVVSLVRGFNPGLNKVVTPWIIENFSEYTNTSQMLSDPRGIYSTGAGELMNPQDILLDNTTGYGTSTKSMEYEWPNRTNYSDRCTDFTISRRIDFPSDVTEVWAEVWVKFSSDFTTIAPGNWNCTSNQDYKFLFGSVWPSVSRFEVKVGTFGKDWAVDWPGGNEIWISSSEYPMSSVWDGNWTRVRVHWKASSTATTPDGSFQLWIGNSSAYSNNSIITSDGSGNPVTAIYSLKLGANMNQGPDHTQELHWGSIKIWNQNPGW